MKLLFVIPARLASTRLPGKMLLKLKGDKSVLQCTYERVLQSSFASRATIVIATDSPLIANETQKFQATSILTSSHCTSGSQRVLETVALIKQDFDIVVNIQGDEPFLNPVHLDLAIQSLLSHPWAQVASVAVRMPGEIPLHEPSKVKVVVDNKHRAMYFSRSPIPFQATSWLWHMGIYAFRGPHALRALVSPWSAAMTPTPLERAENLEQLGWLEKGCDIHISEVARCEFGGIDTPDDYRNALDMINNNSIK